MLIPLLNANRIFLIVSIPNISWRPPKGILPLQKTVVQGGARLHAHYALRWGTFARAPTAAVVSCNVSYKDSIDAKTLVGVLSGSIPVSPWQSHLDTFFNELPKEYIVGVMEENDLTLQNLSSVFNSLHPVFQGKNFRELLHEQG